MIWHIKKNLHVKLRTSDADTLISFRKRLKIQKVINGSRWMIREVVGKNHREKVGGRIYVTGRGDPDRKENFGLHWGDTAQSSAVEALRS
jgi:hypothetical protein